MSPIGVAACRARRSPPGESRRGAIRFAGDTEAKKQPPRPDGRGGRVQNLEALGAGSSQSRPDHQGTVKAASRDLGALTAALREQGRECPQVHVVGEVLGRAVDHHHHHPAGMKRVGLVGIGAIESLVGRAGAAVV